MTSILRWSAQHRACCVARFHRSSIFRETVLAGFCFACDFRNDQFDARDRLSLGLNEFAGASETAHGSSDSRS